jgi:hypothetical protein
MGAAESTTRKASESDGPDFDSLDFYEVLGITEEATGEQIRVRNTAQTQRGFLTIFLRAPTSKKHSSTTLTRT